MEVVAQWAQQDPSTAAQWAVAFPEGGMREKAVASVARNWAQIDAANGSTWVTSLPEGAVRDTALQSFTRGLAEVDPASAAQWAQEIAQPEQPAPGYLGRLGTITSIASDPTGSAQDRARDMVAALGVVIERPLFGAGLGMNVLALNAERGATWKSVHNVYLQYAADLGLPGLALFLALFASCLGGLRRTVRSLRADDARRRVFHLAEGLQLSLTGFAVAAFFHPVGYLFPFFYMAGLPVAVRGVALGSAR